jgi:ATP-dependent helicase/nuclease subunit A
VANLDLKAVAAFWQSELGRAIAARSANVQRELAFTARFSPAELSRETSGGAGLMDDEFVVVQGIADLVVLLPAELWLVDFKTDAVTESGLAARVNEYEPQLRLYALALGSIYRRPVARLCLHFLALGRSVSLTPPAREA